MNDNIFPTVEDISIELFNALYLIKNSPNRARKVLLAAEIEDLINKRISAEVVLAIGSPSRRERSISTTVASTSRMGSTEPQSRKLRSKEGSIQPAPKRSKIEEENDATELKAPSVLKPRLEPGLPKSCNLCGYEELRVLNYGRKDGKNVLECANRNCLKSLGLTNSIVGRVGPQADKYPTSQWGWYLRDPKDLYYPSKQVRNMYQEESRRLKDYYKSNPNVKRPSPFVKKIEDGKEVLYVRCPGQTTLCRVD